MKKVFSVLWRNYNQATFDTLTGVSKGQYDIRLGASKDLHIIFGGLPTSNANANGGYDISLTVEGYSFRGNTVPQQTLPLKFMGPMSARKDWIISSQRPTTAYPMWIDPVRMPGAVDTSSYVIIVRTIDDCFYARVLKSTELVNTPIEFQNAIAKSPDCGIFTPGLHVSNQAEKIYEDLIEHSNLLMYGPPGTGKTTLMQEVVQIFNNGGVSRMLFDETVETDYFSVGGTSANSKSSWTTFHQSYSYEEFVIGMSTDNTSKKLIDIKPSQGKLLELTEFARINGNRALLVIDEMNRANVSKVFGEFITVIEPDKRLDKDGNYQNGTVEIQLPYLKNGDKLAFSTSDGNYSIENPFAMPQNLFTIASMNSIDKSIYPLDSALRRRFFRVDIYPDIQLLEEHFEISGKTYVSNSATSINLFDPEMLKILIRDFMCYLNKKIQVFLGKDYTLGFSYVWRLNEITDPEELIDKFTIALYDQILPQLEEIYRNREEQLLYVIGAEPGVVSPYKIIEPSDEEIELGGMQSFEVNELNNIDLVRWMERICS